MSRTGILAAVKAAKTERIVMPRAVVDRVMASAPTEEATIAEVQAAFESFKKRYDQRWADTQNAIDALNVRGAAFAAGANALSLAPDDPAYTETFANYVRSGEVAAALKDANATGKRQAIHAAMQVGSPGDGGYLAPTEWDRRILKAQTALSPMRRLAEVKVTGVNAYTTLWNDNAWGSGWVGETAARPATGTPALSPITFAAGEIYANPSISQRLLDDADMNFEEWLTGEVQDDFNRQEGIAFITGDGANKPYGLLAYVTGGAAEAVHPGGVLDVVETAGVGVIDGDDLVDFTYGLAAPYRQNASWLMNSQTAAIIAKLKDGNGNYLWREAFAQGQPPTLLGRAVEFDENMPDIGLGELPVAFGDFKAGYVINDRTGVRILRDPYTNKPYVSFYTTKRVGAGVRDPRAIRLLKIKAA